MTTGYFDLSRREGFPTQYPPEKTPVTVDILEAGLIFAFVIIGVAFLTVILGFGLVKSRNAAVKIILSLIIGCCLMLENFGQEWEVGRVDTETPYRAGSAHLINASIGIKLGLRSINVTLKGYGNPNTVLENETINYNERFWWTWDQGRFGFAGLLQRSFREAQRKGLPIPILSVMEYFVVDGEGLRYGRFYRTAGWYTHILIWTAFATWILTNIFLQSVGRYVAYFLALTGVLQILACIVWYSVRNPYPLVIPFENGVITTSYGVNFWMACICGILCLFIAAVVLIMDLRFPDELATFLGLDPIADYDEYILQQNEIENIRERTKMNSNTMELQSPVNIEPKNNTTVMVLKRRTSAKMAQKALYRLPSNTRSRIDESNDDDSPIYENQIIQPRPSMDGYASCSRNQLLLPPKRKHLRN